MVTEVLSPTLFKTLHISKRCHQRPRRAAVLPSRRHVLNFYSLQSEGVGVVLCVKPPTCQSAAREEVQSEAMFTSPSLLCALFYTQADQVLLWQGGCCTLAFTKQPWHATLPDSTSLPSLETDRQAELSAAQTVEDCLENTPSHQQDKVEETGEHVSQGKLRFNIQLISLSQLRSAG